MAPRHPGTDVEAVLRDGAGGVPGVLLLSAWAVPEGAAASLPEVLAALLEASARAAGHVAPRRHAEEGRPLAWRGAEAAVEELLHGVEHERASQACCADSPTLLLAWPGPRASSADEVASRVRERLAEVESAARREREAFTADSAEPVTRKALRMLGLGWLDGLAPARDPVEVASLLRELSDAPLVLEASLHFQQGHHALDACWQGEAPVLAALRTDVAERLRALAPRVALRT